MHFSLSKFVVLNGQIPPILTFFAPKSLFINIYIHSLFDMDTDIDLIFRCPICKTDQCLKRGGKDSDYLKKREKKKKKKKVTSWSLHALSLDE